MNRYFGAPGSSLIFSRIGYCLLVAIAQACAEGERSDIHTPSEGDIPEQVTVAAAELESGFFNGKLRKRERISEFKITRHPIQQHEFAACVSAGGCDSSKAVCTSEALRPFHGYQLPAYDATRDDAPVLCPSIEQAEAYCSWLGARLPTLDEWMLAARGPSVSRYAWGDSESSCEEHPLIAQVLDHQRVLSTSDTTDEERESGADDDEDCAKIDSEKPLSVGQHAAGKSPSGLEDVLLLPGELLASAVDSLVSACGDNFRACIVFGSEPAAIEAVEPAYEITSPDYEWPVSSAAHAYGIRCVWEVGAP